MRRSRVAWGDDPVPSGLTFTDLVVLERYGDPRAMLAAGGDRLAGGERFGCLLLSGLAVLVAIIGHAVGDGGCACGGWPLRVVR